MGDVLLYDPDCGFCTRVAGWLERRMVGAGVRSLAAVDLAALGVDAGRAEREVPFRHADGRVTWGSAAVADALVACPRPWRLLGLLLRTAPAQVVARPVYVVVARNRHRLPGGTAACRLPRPDKDATERVGRQQAP